MAGKRLLIIAVRVSDNTRKLADSLVQGSRASEVRDVETVLKGPLETAAEDVLAADAVILMTTENLGYMAGAMKDFFDRCYYPCLERTQGRPFALVVRAGQDGTGTVRAITSITTGLRWRAVAEPLVCRGEWDERFLEEARDLGMAMAAGLEAGIF